VGLTQWLFTDERGGASPRSLRSKLQRPWGWPAAPWLAEKARSHSLHPPEALREGEGLLVSVGADALWQVSPRREHPDALELRGAAAASALLAQRLVTRDLPLYDEPDRLHRGRTWYAVRFDVVPSDAPPTALDGGSFGLSLSLTTASDLLRLPLPPDLAATGVLQPDGSVGPVEGLSKKVELLLAHAPGVARFLVPAGQAEEAQSAIDKAHDDLGIPREQAWLVIVPVATFPEAFALTFPTALDQMRERWKDPEVASRLARQLHRVALFDSPVVLGWSAIGACAQELLRAERPAPERKRLEMVRAIAHRHGGHKEPHPWPAEGELAQEPRAARLRYLAHVVQSEAEGGDDPGAAADRAHRLVRPRLERASEDAVLLGAIGRALGAAERDEEAISVLQDAVATWQDIGAPYDSTHALCELLRLLGITARRADVDVVVRRDLPTIEADPRTSDKSLGFVRVALGRAYTQTKQPLLALRELRDVPDGRALPLIAEAGRLRWLALATDAVGDPIAADRIRERLADRKAPPYPWILQTKLARLDAARRDGTVTEELRADLATTAELSRSLTRCPAGRDWAAHLTERSRY
jgi:hypothetical protein